MSDRATKKYLLFDYMDHVKICISGASNSVRIEWFERVEQLFKQVLIYLL